MRLSLAAVTLAVLSRDRAPAFAQAPAPAPTDRTKATVFKADDLAAALAKLPGDRPSSAVRVFTLAPYNVNVERRLPKPQGASLHEAQGELFYVIEGSATLLTGGTLVAADAHRHQPGRHGHRGRHAPDVQQGRLPDRALGPAAPVRGHPGAGAPDVDLPAERASVAAATAAQRGVAAMGARNGRACVAMRRRKASVDDAHSMMSTAKGRFESSKASRNCPSVRNSSGWSPITTRSRSEKGLPRP